MAVSGHLKLSYVRAIFKKMDFKVNLNIHVQTKLGLY